MYVAAANVTFEQPSIQLEAGQSALINVYFEQPVSDIKHLLYGGFLVISTDDDVALVPFYGSLDNQKDLPIFDTKVKKKKKKDDTVNVRESWYFL